MAHHFSHGFGADGSGFDIGSCFACNHGLPCSQQNPARERSRHWNEFSSIQREQRAPRVTARGSKQGQALGFGVDTLGRSAAVPGMARPLSANEQGQQEVLTELLRKLRRGIRELGPAGKSAGWKLALAAESQTRTTATNRWLATTLHLGNLHEVSRKVAAWTRNPDPALVRGQNRVRLWGLG